MGLEGFPVCCFERSLTRVGDDFAEAGTQLLCEFPIGVGAYFTGHRCFSDRNEDVQDRRIYNSYRLRSDTCTRANNKREVILSTSKRKTVYIKKDLTLPLFYARAIRQSLSDSKTLYSIVRQCVRSRARPNTVPAN